MSEYTNEKKAQKFDLLLEEYNRLMAYRHNLAGTVISNVESIMEERKIKQDTAVIFIQVDKKLDGQSIMAIQQEIARIDTIISFINSIIYGDEKTTFESSINNSYIKQDIENENNGTDTKQAS